MWLRTLSLVVFVSLAGGCASLGEDGQRVDASEFRCPRGLTRPFSVETLVRVGRRQGVSLKRDDSCYGDSELVDSASNIVRTDSLDEQDAIDAREGTVLCHLEDLPFAKPPFDVIRTKYPTDQETYLRVANVDCAIYPTEEGQIARLQAAFEALARAPVEQRSCPHKPGKPVTVGRLIAVAKTKGLRLLPDARCVAPGVVAQASTLVPYESPADDYDVELDQGDVTCLVRGSAGRRATTIRTTALTVGRRFDLLNVSCTIRPFRPNGTAQVARLRATLKGLR